MLSKNLKIFRKRKGLTQENVAEALNVVRQTISKWEKGISVPDADMLIKLAETFLWRGRGCEEVCSREIELEKAQQLCYI